MPGWEKPNKRFQRKRKAKMKYWFRTPLRLYLVPVFRYTKKISKTAFQGLQSELFF
ncbi:hypothetical protein J6590_096354, partial [Homalodisca vitripennis]